MGVEGLSTDGTALTISIGKFGSETVTQIGGLPVAQIQMFILLDQSPLEAMHSISL